MTLQYPTMRAWVVDALQALGDPEYQRRVWLEHHCPEPNFVDNLDENVHILFDDVDVCVDPAGWVGIVLHPPEVEPLRKLGEAFGAMIDDLGDVPDEVYLADPRWPTVVELARAAHDDMTAEPA